MPQGTLHYRGNLLENYRDSGKHPTGAKVRRLLMKRRENNKEHLLNVALGVTPFHHCTHYLLVCDQEESVKLAVICS